MKVRTRFAVIDVLINYILLTPLVLLFWYGTYALIDVCIIDRIASRPLAAGITLIVGFGYEFAITYWQTALASRGVRLKGVAWIIYTRGYNYALAVANIMHYRGVQEFYDILVADPDELGVAVQAAATAIVLLWSLRAGRNITAVPFAVSVDTDAETWFDASTLYQYSSTQRLQYLLDVFVTVAVVWTLGPLLWISLGYVFDNVVFPNDFRLSVIASCVLGYGTVGVCSLMQGRAKHMSCQFERENRTVFKTAFEDVFIFIATAGVIMCWKGVGMMVDALASQFPIEHFDMDFTGLYANVVSFALLALCYATGSLIGKGAEMDGSSSEGAGVEFSTEYFAHFFQDFLVEKEKEEMKFGMESKKLK